MNAGVTPGEAQVTIPGERGRAVVARSFATLQSRVQTFLALGVVLLLGGGFLIWYYNGVAESSAQAAHPVKPAVAQGEMKLPPLGPAPKKKPDAQPAVSPALVQEDSAEAQALLGGTPTTTPAGQAVGAAAPVPSVSPSAPPPPDPVLQRRLGSPVLVQAISTAASPALDPETSAGDARGAEARALDGPLAAVIRPDSGPAGSSPLASMLRPTVLTATAAGVLPDRRWLLPKGAFIDCTLETAIDSTLPGMTSCITATDVWSADGSVVLMERGTKLIGETRGGVAQGQERLFVLWSEARTPAGVAVSLASPGTDALGRAGVTGAVDTHFAARFGAAILISLIDAGAAAIVAAQNNGGSSVVVSTQSSQDVVSEVLRQTVSIPPTISVPQGERVQVLVARDVNFGEVYALEHRP